MHQCLLPFGNACWWGAFFSSLSQFERPQPTCFLLLFSAHSHRSLREELRAFWQERRNSEAIPPVVVALRREARTHGGVSTRTGVKTNCETSAKTKQKLRRKTWVLLKTDKKRVQCRCMNVVLSITSRSSGGTPIRIALVRASPSALFGGACRMLLVRFVVPAPAPPTGGKSPPLPPLPLPPPPPVLPPSPSPLRLLPSRLSSRFWCSANERRRPGAALEVGAKGGPQWRAPQILHASRSGFTVPWPQLRQLLASGTWRSLVVAAAAASDSPCKRRDGLEALPGAGGKAPSPPEAPEVGAAATVAAEPLLPAVAVVEGGNSTARLRHF